MPFRDPGPPRELSHVVPARCLARNKPVFDKLWFTTTTTTGTTGTTTGTAAAAAAATGHGDHPRGVSAVCEDQAL